MRSGSALPPQTRRPSWNWTQSASNRWLPEIESSSARSASASSSPPGSAGLPPAPDCPRTAPDCTGGPLRLRRWPARSHNSTHPWRTARGCGRWTRNRRPGEGPEGQAREFPDRTFYLPYNASIQTHRWCVTAGLFHDPQFHYSNEAMQLQSPAGGGKASAARGRRSRLLAPPAFSGALCTALLRRGTAAGPGAQSGGLSFRGRRPNALSGRHF